MLDQNIKIDGPKVQQDSTGASCPILVTVLLWEFECRNCQTTFETPVPRGPKEEHGIRCPACQGKDIKRINVGKLTELACGG
jgi:Zn finger protein HypA/HybF involved in hydrogenase expression